MRKDDILIDELIRKVDVLDLKLDNHMEGEMKKYDELLLAVNKNTVATERQITKTEGLIEAWEAATGVVKVINWMSKCAKVLAPLAIIGVFGTWLLKKGGWF